MSDANSAWQDVHFAAAKRALENAIDDLKRSGRPMAAVRVSAVLRGLK